MEYDKYDITFKTDDHFREACNLQLLVVFEAVVFV